MIQGELGGSLRRHEEDDDLEAVRMVSGRFINSRRGEPGSLRIPYGEPKRKIRARRMRRVVRKGVVATVCCAGLACLGLLGMRHGHAEVSKRALPVKAEVVADSGGPEESPSEWTPTLERWGLVGTPTVPKIDAAQEKVLLTAENYCARFGEYPEQSNFAAGWTYSKTGQEMTLQGPGGSYDSLQGWNGGGSAAASGTGSVGVSSKHLRMSWAKGQVETWLDRYLGVRLTLPANLDKVTLDYHADQHKGTLLFTGVTMPQASESFSETVWNQLPLTSQRAVFRPELLQAILGSSALHAEGNLWLPLLLSRRDEWVGFGLNSPLDLDSSGQLTELRTQLALLARGQAPSFLLTSDDSLPIAQGGALTVTEPTPGLRLVSLGAAPAAAEAGAPVEKGKAGPHDGLLAAGVSDLRFSAEEEVAVDWQVTSSKEGILVSFVTRALPVSASTDPEAKGPELEQQHRTHTNVVAGE